jgi:hypothetical protein
MSQFSSLLAPGVPMHIDEDAETQISMELCDGCMGYPPEIPTNNRNFA